MPCAGSRQFSFDIRGSSHDTTRDCVFTAFATLGRRLTVCFHVVCCDGKCSSSARTGPSLSPAGRFDDFSGLRFLPRRCPNAGFLQWDRKTQQGTALSGCTPGHAPKPTALSDRAHRRPSPTDPWVDDGPDGNRRALLRLLALLRGFTQQESPLIHGEVNDSASSRSASHWR